MFFPFFIENLSSPFLLCLPFSQSVAKRREWRRSPVINKAVRQSLVPLHAIVPPTLDSTFLVIANSLDLGSEQLPASRSMQRKAGRVRAAGLGIAAIAHKAIVPYRSAISERLEELE